MSPAVVPAPTSLLRDNRFCSFWTGQAVSQFGDRISELAFPLIAVLVLDASPSEVAVLTALVWLPNLLSIFLGAWVDHRTHKRRLLVIADLVRAVLLLTLPAAYALHVVTIAQLYVVALLTGAGAVLFNMAYPPVFVSLGCRPLRHPSPSSWTRAPSSPRRCSSDAFRSRSPRRPRARPPRSRAGRRTGYVSSSATPCCVRASAVRQRSTSSRSSPSRCSSSSRAAGSACRRG